jgi:hypothetical protein
MFEKADERKAKPVRKVTLRGKFLNVDDPSPMVIARALRKNKQDKLDAKRARESKLAGR